MVTRNRAKRGEVMVVFGQVDRMLLQQPAVPGNHPGGRLEERGHGICAADSLAESRHPEQVVAHRPAGLAEVVEHARLDLLRRVGREERPHADGELVPAPEPERELLVREIAGVDDAGQSKAVRVRVQIGGAAQLLFGRLRRLERGDGGGR